MQDKFSAVEKLSLFVGTWNNGQKHLCSGNPSNKEDKYFGVRLTGERGMHGEHGTGRNGAVMADVQVLAYQDIKMGGLFEADSVAGNTLN